MGSKGVLLLRGRKKERTHPRGKKMIKKKATATATYRNSTRTKKKSTMELAQRDNPQELRARIKLGRGIYSATRQKKKAGGERKQEVNSHDKITECKQDKQAHKGVGRVESSVINKPNEGEMGGGGRKRWEHVKRNARTPKGKKTRIIFGPKKRGGS